MKLTRFEIISILAALLLAPGLTNAQDCKTLYRKAHNLRLSQKYDDAIKTYEQVENCGDSTISKESKRLVTWIMNNRPSKGKSKQNVQGGFQLSPEQVIIPNQGGQETVKIQGSAKWTFTLEGDWCTVKRNGNELIITCEDENESLEERIAHIEVECGSQKKSIIVTNDGAIETLRSSANELNFPATGESGEVDVVANTEWEIMELPEWIEVQKGEASITFHVKPNPQNKDREANVKLVTPTNLTTIIKISQSSNVLNEQLSFSKNDLTFSKDGGDEVVRVYTDAPGWKIANFPSWIQLTRIGNDSLRIHCVPNDPVGLVRGGSVNITTGNQTLGINVGQMAKPIVALLPSHGIGGRALSLSINGGYIMPMISTSADGFTGSVVNYALGTNAEEASYKAGSGFSVGLHADIRIYHNVYLMAGINYLQYSYKNKFDADVYRRIYQTDRYFLAGNTQNIYDEDYKMSFLEVPVLLSYRLPVTRNESHVQFNCGPVMSYGLSAKMDLSGYTSSQDTYYYVIENGNLTDYLYDKTPHPLQDRGSGDFDLYGKSVSYVTTNAEGKQTDRSANFDDAPLKRLNVGARLGVAYEYRGISLGLEYTYMLSNMANSKYWESKRWRIFDQDAPTTMMGYKQCNHYLGIKLGYTFRY